MMIKQRPFGVDASDYPFQSQWYERGGSLMHYVDKGAGVPVVMCHGNPTWSYVYRRIIKSMSADCRCIAFDLPGFGFSDHPPGYSYRPEQHAEWVEALLFHHLKLERCILVVQDWGGPIGLSIATRYPERIAGMVISSTWAWPPTRVAKIFSALMGTRFGQYLILQRNFFATTLVAFLLGKSATPAALKAYAAPFPTPESRRGTAVFPVELVASTAWLTDIESRLARLSGKPVEFVFGLKDLGTRRADVARWLRHYPHAGVQVDASAGHYTQEACPEKYVEAIRRILKLAK